MTMFKQVANLQPLADKAAIGLSLLCALHCLATPLLVSLLPSVLALGFEDEALHTWMVFIVVPMSAFALTLGCRKHRQVKVLVIGIPGLLLLCLAPLLGHEFLGEAGEKLVTLTGAALIAVSHVRNFLLCRASNDCACPDST